MNPSSPSGVSRQDAPKPVAVYYCMECPETFVDAASSNAHYDATGHGQTWRPSMAFHAPSPQPDQKVGATRQPASSSSETATEAPPTIRELQRINQARSERWMAGSPGWTTLEIAGELAGEVGELANICKKLRRSEMGVPGNKLTDAELLEQARGECGDVFIVLMLTASKLGIDLYDATRDAFNKKSEQMGFPERFASSPPVPAEAPNEDTKRLDWMDTLSVPEANQVFGRICDGENARYAIDSFRAARSTPTEATNG